MIAFACAVTVPETYERHALRGFRLAAEDDSPLIAPVADGTLSRAYNAILAELPEGLEAVVLAHQDLEITNSQFCSVVRTSLADPEVAIVGAAGAGNVTSLSWWDPGPVIGSYEWVYSADGGGKVSMDDWDNFVAADSAHRVDALDGMILVFSPWAIENLRFDEELDPGAHGYDIDVCFQAREAGKTVVVADLGVSHHHEIVLMDDSAPWTTAHRRFAEKWEGRTDAIAPGLDWKERARRAEAQAAAAEIARNELSIVRNLAERRGGEAWRYAHELEHKLERLQRELDQIKRTWDWRLFHGPRVRRVLGRFAPGPRSGGAD